MTTQPQSPSEQGTNLPPTETSMPVRLFLAQRWLTIETRIAGLLDYGYSAQQISDQLRIPLKQVVNIIGARGFRYANEMTQRKETK